MDITCSNVIFFLFDPFFSFFSRYGTWSQAMSLRMQLRRTVKVIMTHDYWTLALNCHSKKYQIIYESVYSYLFQCMRNKYSCKSEFVWNVHIQVMLKVIIISILDQHAWACWDMVARGIVFLNSQTGSQMYTFPDQMNWQFVQILMDSKFQSKLRVLDTDDVKQKTSLFSVQGKSA